MQYNDVASKQGIIQDCSFLLGNSVDLNNYTLADRTRNGNQRYHLVWEMIFESYGGWIFMDGNTSRDGSVPYADQNITSGTNKYYIPTKALTIRGVAVLMPGTVWRDLIPLTQEEYK